MKILLLILLLLAASFAEAATPLDPNLPNNTWQKIVPNLSNRYVCSDQYTCQTLVNHTGPVGRSFGGDAFGGGNVYYFGGGHFSHSGNDLEIYNIASNTWVQQFYPAFPEALPTSCIANPGSNADPANPCRVAGGQGTTAITPLGRSYTEHMYQQQAWDPSVSKYVMVTWSGVWEWTLGVGWTRLSTIDPTVAGGSDSFAQVLTYSPPIGKLLTMGTEVNRGVYEFTRGVGWSGSTVTWPTASPNCAYQNGIAEVYDPFRQVHWISCSDSGAMLSYNPVSHALTQVTGIPSGAQGAQHIAFDTINNVLLTVKSNGSSLEIWTLNTSNVWAQITPANSGPVGSGTTSSPTLQFDAANQVFWFLNVKSVGGGWQGGNNEGDVELWAYRYQRTGTTRTVCASGCTHTTPAAAAAAAQNFDRIEIQSGTYGQPGSCALWKADNLYIIGTGATRPIIDAQNTCDVTNNATWNLTGSNITVDNIEITRSYPDEWGIYAFGPNPTIRNSYLHDNPGTAILASNGGGTIIIENTRFFNNGDIAGCGGQDHNIYVSEDFTTFIFRYNYSRQANCGHTFKSRAQNSYVLYNRFTDENDSTTGGGDTTSAAADLAQGGRAYVIGNTFRKSNCSDAGDVIVWNSTMTDTGGPTYNPLQELYLINNTFDASGVTTGACNNLSSVRMVRLHASAPTVLTAQIKNNIFDSHGAISNFIVLIDNAAVTPVVTSANNLCYGAASDRATYCPGLTNNNPLFVNQAAFDYSLQSGSPAINAGADPGTAAGYSLTPTRQYVHIASSSARTQSGAAIDIGAFEGAGGVVITPPSNVRVTRAQ